MLNKIFWVKASERAVKSAAQAVVLALSLSEAGPVNAFGLDWKLALGSALGGAVLSYLTSVMTVGVGPSKNDPSAV